MASNPTIKPRRGTSAPGVGAINQNELAVDTTNKRIYIGAADGSGTLIGSAPGGSDTQVQFNEGGNLSGDSGLTYNKTTDTLTITGDLSVNGGDITTTVTGTATLFNTNATTLNLGGVATAITMGATSGTTTTIRGGTLVGNTTTQNVFNTTATTVNAFGAAELIYFGRSVGSCELLFNSDTSVVIATSQDNKPIYLNSGGGEDSASLTVSGSPSPLSASISLNATLISTNKTFVDFFNTNATTVNAFGAATTLTMGATSGTTTTIRGGTLVGNTTTQNLFNTTATTLNLGGAATTMAIGNTATAAQTVNMFTASTGASTYNFATGATAAGTTKTLNIGTGGSGTSLTNINIGTGSSGSPNVGLGSTSGGSTSFYSPDVYFPSSVYFGAALVEDNAIFSTIQTMVTDASITLYTAGTNMYLGGDNGEIIVSIGDYDGVNDGTLITVDEYTDTITFNAGSGVTVNQDLAVNGGDITTTVTGTATLFNTNATTLNLGGVATAITMGATSGTTTTIRGGTLVGNTTTQNVFNTTATTVNAFGAATTVNMGGASTNTVFAGTVEIDGTNALQFPDGTVQVTRTPDFILFDFGII